MYFYKGKQIQNNCSNTYMKYYDYEQNKSKNIEDRKENKTPAQLKHEATRNRKIRKTRVENNYKNK